MTSDSMRQDSQPERPAQPRLSEHDALRGAREAVDAAIVAHAGNRVTWAESLGEALLGLQHVVVRHRAAAEAPGGTLAEMVALKPGLMHRVERQRAEHLTLLRDLSDLREILREQVVDRQIGVALARGKAGSLQDALRRHMANGTDMLYEAYFVDEGGEA